jgi:hypothetical protein
MVHHNWEAARVAVSRFAEWPLWDPFHCGGVSILGNPETQIYSPLFLLTFALGSVLAIKVFLLIHVTCALLGMYLLARRHYRCTPAPAALAAIAWGLSGFFAWHGAGGHATFLPFAFAPWLVMSFRRGLADIRSMVATAALLALVLVEGGTYPFPYFLLLLGFELSYAWVTSNGRIIPHSDDTAAGQFPAAFNMRNVLWLGLLTGMLGAIRLVPIALSLGHHPRYTVSTDSLALSEVWLMLTAREHGWHFPPHPYVWSEYGTYVGFFVLFLALAGAVLCVKRGQQHLLVGFGLFGLLMLGNVAPFFPWPLLHTALIYDSLQVPSRFAVLFTFYLALIAAIALEQASAAMRKQHRALGALVYLLVAGQFVDMLMVNHKIVDRWHGTPISTDSPAPAFYMVKGEDYYETFASYPQRNIGTPMCYTGSMNWSISPALWTDPSPQTRILPENSGHVLSWDRSANRLWANVELDSPATLIWNQNFAPGFRVNKGRLSESQGRLAVELPAGRHDVEIKYAPRSLGPSVAASALGVVVALVLLRQVRRKAHDHLKK